jgi:hypothetical protein
MATTRDSTLYASQIAKQLQDNRKYISPMQAIPFEFTTISIFATGDIYNLCVLPANCRVVGFTIGALASIAVTAAIVGDAGDTDRYAVSATLAGVVSLPMAGTAQGYTPTTDTIVYITLVTTTPIAGTVKGCFYVIPAY